MPSGWLRVFSTSRILRTVSRIRSWLAWLMLMRNTSAPARASSSMTLMSSEAGPRVATIFTRRKRLIGLGYSLSRCRWSSWRLGAPSHRDWGCRCRRPGSHRDCRSGVGIGAVLVGGVGRRIGQLQRPIGLVLRVDLKEPGALIAAREAILDAE